MRSRLWLVSAPLLFAQGSGDLTFTLGVVQLADGPRRVAAADLDGDGDVDLCVVSQAAGSNARLQVLENQGGAFAFGWSLVQGIGTLGEPWDVDLVDTDGDLDLDLLYALPSGEPFQRFNDGAGGFDLTGELPASSAVPRAEQNLADMDGDGAVDLVYSELDLFGYFGTHAGNGDGSFQPFPNDVPSGAFDFANRFDLGLQSGSGDLNGDGLRDAVMASTSGLTLLRGKAPTFGTLPGWVQPETILGQACRDVVVVDLDGDAHPDVLATVPALNAVAVLLGMPPGAPGAPTFYVAGRKPDAIAVADLDLDGFQDVVVANPTTSSVTVLRGAAGGVLLAPEAHLVGRRPTDIAAADLDGDGDVDLAVTCAISRRVALLFNDTL